MIATIRRTPCIRAARLQRQARPLIPCMRLCPFTLYSLIARARTAPAEFPAKTAAHARRSAARSNRCHLPNARTYPTRMSAAPSRIIHSRNGMHKKMSSMPAAISAYPHIRPVQGLRIVLCLSSGHSSTQRTRSPPRFYLYAPQPVQILRAVRAPITRTAFANAQPSPRCPCAISQ